MQPAASCPASRTCFVTDLGDVSGQVLVTHVAEAGRVGVGKEITHRGLDGRGQADNEAVGARHGCAGGSGSGSAVGNVEGTLVRSIGGYVRCACTVVARAPFATCLR